MVADFFRPTLAEIAAAKDKVVPDILAPNLQVVFCGINPGLYTAAVGHHFGRPGNRFWPTLHQAGFTPRLFSPFEDRALLTLGYGITNIVARASTAADELTPAELRAGAKILQEKIARCRPALVAFTGITAYRAAFDRKKAVMGLQPETLAESRIWVLPNPSGLNAHYHPRQLADLFRALRDFAAALPAPSHPRV